MLLGAIVLVGWILIVWPYMLGTWLAVQAGAAPGSSTRNVTGWALEVLWLAVLIWAGTTAARRAKLRRAQEERRRREQIAQSAAELLHRMDATAGLPASEDFTIADWQDVELIQPRVHVTGGPKEPTTVDRGYLHVASNVVQFIGPVKQLEWPARRICDVIPQIDFVELPLSNRKTVSGVATDADRLPLVRASLLCAVGTAQADQHSLDQARVLLGQVAQQGGQSQV